MAGAGFIPFADTIAIAATDAIVGTKTVSQGTITDSIMKAGAFAGAASYANINDSIPGVMGKALKMAGIVSAILTGVNVANEIASDDPYINQIAGEFDLVPNSVEFHNPKSSFPSKRLPF